MNKEFLAEVCTLRKLSFLHIDGITTDDLSELGNLRTLERLIIIGGTKVHNLDWVHGLSGLTALGIENFPRVSSLTPLARLDALHALSVEGSMWKSMHVESLSPLSCITSLEYLFLTNLRVADRLLEPLRHLQRLRVLECADFFAPGEMERLRLHLSGTRCSWFDLIGEYGSARAGKEALLSKLQGKGG